MNVQYREATKHDLKSIQSLNLKLFEKEYKEYDSLLNLDWTFGKISTEYYAKRISKEDGCVIISTLEEKIIGYICGGLQKGEEYRKIKKLAELENMFILEEYRSQGIGEELYSIFLDWCTQQGVTKIKVNASIQNEKAINFYKKNGFHPYSLTLECDI